MRQSVLLPTVLLLELFFVVVPFLFMMHNLPSTNSKAEWEEIGRESSGLVKNGHTGDSNKLNVIEEGTKGIVYKDEIFRVPVLRSNASLENETDREHSRKLRWSFFDVHGPRDTIIWFSRNEQD